MQLLMQEEGQSAVQARKRDHQRQALTKCPLQHAAQLIFPERQAQTDMCCRKRLANKESVVKAFYFSVLQLQLDHVRTSLCQLSRHL